MFLRNNTDKPREYVIVPKHGQAGKIVKDTAEPGQTVSFATGLLDTHDVTWVDQLPQDDPDTSSLTMLGKAGVRASRTLETFPAPQGIETVIFRGKELTAFCPVTSQPDFYQVEITYWPDERTDGEGRCIESKSLKLYLESFRNEGHFAEALASIIAKDVCRATGVGANVRLVQQVRGGLELEASASISPHDLEERT